MKSQITAIQIHIICALLFLPVVVKSQEIPFLGPRSFSLGHSSTALADEYSIFNNPGTLGFVENGSIASGCLSLYQVEGLNSVFATFTAAFKNGAFSIGAFNLGDEIYNTNRVSMGFGNKLGLASLGSSINYNHYYFEGLDAYGFITVDVGGLAEIGPLLSIAASIKNITQTKISRYTGEYFPTLMSTCLSYKPTNLIILNCQYDKDLENPGRLKLGLEYNYSSLVLRAGLTTDPSLLSFGLGFHHKKLRIDYGLANHQVLNSSHTISISYYFKNA